MPLPEIDKVYNPDIVEERIYDFWLEKNYFHGNANSEKEPYTIVIPPPNVTDRLHMGHAYNNAIQDILIRYKKMQGFETMWMPGTDHAGIATQTVIEKNLAKNENLTRHDLGRKAFVERVWAWKEKHGAIIIEQLKKLGCACDWERERFTMDEGLNQAVLEVFISLYNRGLIYRGQRIVNWDPASATALADDEVEHKEINGKLYHIRYKFVDSDAYLIVATTRPETLLGDTGIAVSPADDEKKKLIGRKVIVPFVNREIEIFADEYVDKDFGSGFVKVTPAHDPNDFEMGQRHELDQIIMMDKDGKILPVCRKVRGDVYTDELAVPELLAGVERFEARRRIIAGLEESGHIEKIEDYVHAVGHSYRSKVPVEPYLSEQWFVKMKPLAEKALAAVKSGKVKFYPEDRFEKTYEHWMTNIRDWCISRQLWWGHRIPVWYNEKGDYKVCREDPSSDGEKWTQDPDVLDTWFSSQLWPFSTLGWPEKTDDLAFFYPTNTLVTGADIIFFWVARMIMSGLEFKDEVPFESVYFNGIVRDAKGQKMSKSLGNGIDPLAMVDAYSADAVRYSLLALSSEGHDIHLAEKDFELGRNFTNKLWNSFRLLASNLDDTIPPKATAKQIQLLLDAGELDIADQWILSLYSKTINAVSESMERFRFHDVVSALYGFFWSEYCDWYLELIKPRVYADDGAQKQPPLITATFILRGILKMLHPLVPFITEEIWHHIGTSESESIMVADWPSADAVFEDDAAESSFELIRSVIVSVRTIRGEMNIPVKKEAEILISGANEEAELLFNSNRSYFSHLARVSDLKVGETIARPSMSATSVVKNMEVFVPLSGLIDIDVERNRLQKERDRLGKQVENLTRKLQNNDFVKRAPKHVVDNERKKLENFQHTREKIVENLKQLGN